MATIVGVRTASGKLKYRVQVRLKGARTAGAYFARRTDAKVWASQTETAIREGRYFKTAEAKRRTVRELVERYLETEAPVLRSRDDRECQLRWWRAEVGHLSLADLTPSLLAEQQDRLLLGKDRGEQGRSKATVNRYLAALSSACSFAVKKLFWLDENPCRRVARHKESRGRLRYLTEPETQSLLAACKASSNRYLHPLVVLAVSTGARRGELLGLRWRQVDLLAGVIRLEHTKNNERRSLPLGGRAMEAIRGLHQVRRLDTDLVFPSRNGRRPIEVRKSWEEALVQAGIEDFRFHDLRHTAASYLAMSGATTAEIAEVLGHKTLAMVKRYSHLSTEHGAGVVARMNEKFLSEEAVSPTEGAQ